jgi:hypothetical protein
MPPYRISIDARSVQAGRDYFTQVISPFGLHFDLLFEHFVHSILSAYQPGNSPVEYDMHYDYAVDAIVYEADNNYKCGEDIYGVCYGTFMPAFYTAAAQSIHEQIHQATRGMALRAQPIQSPPWSDRLYLEITPINAEQDHDP